MPAVAPFIFRAPIPWARDAFASGRAALPAGLPAYRHIGLYAYRAAFLKAYSGLAVSPWSTPHKRNEKTAFRLPY